MKRYLLILVFIYSCRKEQACETWAYYDQCVPKSGSVQGCNSTSNRTQSICGNALDGVFAGSVKTVHEDAYARIDRHYINRIK